MRKQTIIMTVFFIMSLIVFCVCPEIYAEEAPSIKRNTDIQIDSAARDPLDKFNEDKDRDYSNLVPLNESTSVGLNDNGDPNIGTRF